MYKTLAVTLATAIATFTCSTTFAQSTTDVMAKANSAYLQDSRGVIVRSGSGMCWRTNYWTPADAVLGCDGDLLPPVVNVIAPPIVQQASSVPTPSPLVPPPVRRCDFSLTLESDQTFNFNSAVLSAAAKNRINEQMHNANCAHIEKIVVSGYTDHLGSDQLNQSLSTKRAAAVAEYLQQSGIEAPIDQRGMGKQQELKTCKEIKILKKLIDCLAPNRRVDIEVKGVR